MASASRDWATRDAVSEQLLAFVQGLLQQLASLVVVAHFSIDLAQGLPESRPGRRGAAEVLLQLLCGAIDHLAYGQLLRLARFGVGEGEGPHQEGGYVLGPSLLGDRQIALPGGPPSLRRRDPGENDERCGNHGGQPMAAQQLADAVGTAGSASRHWTFCKERAQIVGHGIDGAVAFLGVRLQRFQANRVEIPGQATPQGIGS